MTDPIPTSNLDIFQPIGGYNGETAFAFVQSTDTANKTTIRAFNLNSGIAGSWQSDNPAYAVSVPDSLVFDPSSAPPSTTPTTTSPPSKTPSIGLVAGSALGALAVLAAAFYFGYYRCVVLKRKAGQITKQGKNEAINGSGDIVVDGGDVGITAGILESSNHLTDSGLHELQKIPYYSFDRGPQKPAAYSMDYPFSIPLHSPSTRHSRIVPSAPLEPISDPVEHQFRFSTHPRPVFVKSISEKELAQDSIQSRYGSISKAFASWIPNTPVSFSPTSSNTVLSNNPHSLLASDTLSLPSDNLHTSAAAFNSTPDNTSSPPPPLHAIRPQNIPVVWESVIHNPHTEPFL
ncbi:hypothetical protein BC939DRAFT_466771 [Gamsiella multidivaricata]|uniref:uncharacterized protein n=1 Tax=Gamsiella multidivaricata TaxID=101098 RepID=UPI00221F6CFD|nr:uncharacterized protein BC939DRAFT_466771 [Gamsiella multidivaricata]KAI7817133.1 hypothetical protein BC939DRAFT_466771 [Gamsiella multidivaricata]